jgi:hypothetical protein
LNQWDTRTSGAISFHSRLRQYGGRVLATTLLWSVFGLIVGGLMAPPGTIGLVANGVAGVIVLTPLGMLVGLLGGRWKETLLCGLIGISVGAMRGAWGDADGAAFSAAVGLVCGGIVGATFVSVFYRLPRLVVGLISLRA